MAMLVLFARTTGTGLISSDLAPFPDEGLMASGFSRAGIRSSGG
jgi:hypothetical protein